MAKPKVLIVEDEIIIAMDLRHKLQSLGYSICSFATSGEKAIETVEREKPDVVLMDIKLRGEMDGFEAAKLIRSDFGIPILFMTGYPISEFEGKAEISEPYEYLAKPVQIDALQIAIDSVLQR